MSILLGLVAGLFIAHTSITPEELGKRIEQGLRERIGKVEEVHVTVEGPRGLRLLKGNLRRVEIRLKGFDSSKIDLRGIASEPSGIVLARGRARAAHIGEMVVDCQDFIYDATQITRLVLDLQDVRYDIEAAKKRSQFRILAMGSGTAEVQLSEASLQKKVVPMLQGITDPSVTLGSNRLIVSGKKEVMYLPVPFTVEGKLKPRRNQIHFVNPELKVGLLQMPQGFTQWLLRSINPVYVFDVQQELPFAVDIKSLTVQSKVLIARAALSLRPSSSGQPQQTGSRALRQPRVEACQI